MTLIDDILDAVADPDTGLWDALDAADTAAGHLERAKARRNGSLGAEMVLRRAQVEVERAAKLVPVLDEPFRGLFDVLLSVYDKLDAYRVAAADESLEEWTHPIDGGSVAYEFASDGLEYAEAIARKVLAEALAVESAVMAA